MHWRIVQTTAFGASRRLPVTVFALIFALASVPLEFTYSQTETFASSLSRDQLYDELAEQVAALQQHANILKRVVQLARPSVVHIEAEKTDENGVRRSAIEEAGAGIVIRYQGKDYILTNRHVIKNAALSKIKVELADSRQIYPKRIWSDGGTDVAIMAVSEPGLIPARLGDSSSLEIGDFVLAFGSPFGLSHSVTYGIISAKGRRDLRLGDEGVRFQDFLQTDAAINPGNSGGPLLNLRGEVVGINTAIASSSGGNEGIGFSIPINLVMLVASQLIERGNVSRAYLGVRLDIDFDLEKATRLGLTRLYGALVTGITPNSPAEAARLRAGDVILEFDGVRIEDDRHLVNRVSLTRSGSEVEVVVLREGRPITVNVVVGDRDAFEGSSR